MTNQENIKNAATNYGYAVAGGSLERGYIQDAFEAGAKWKDQQFKEYLEKSWVNMQVANLYMLAFLSMISLTNYLKMEKIEDFEKAMKR